MPTGKSSLSDCCRGSSLRPFRVIEDGYAACLGNRTAKGRPWDRTSRAWCEEATNRGDTGAGAGRRGRLRGPPWRSLCCSRPPSPARTMKEACSTFQVSFPACPSPRGLRPGFPCGPPATSHRPAMSAAEQAAVSSSASTPASHSRSPRASIPHRMRGHSGDAPATHFDGLALQLRYDYLGLAPHLTNPPASPMQIVARASATRSRFSSRCPSLRRCGGRRSTPAPCRSPGASGRDLRPHRQARAHRCLRARLDHADRRSGPPDPHVRAGSSRELSSPVTDHHPPRRNRCTRHFRRSMFVASRRSQP